MTLQQARDPWRPLLVEDDLGRAVVALARPRTDTPGFRQNDAVARELLRALTEVAPTVSAGPTTRRSPYDDLRDAARVFTLVRP